MKVNARTSIAFILLLVAVSSVAPVLTPAKGAMLLYNSGNPTPDQQLVLEYINRARANPIAEGQRLGIDIHEGLEDDPSNGCYGPEYVGVRPPLAMNPLLLGIAQGHTEDMYNLNYFSHDDPNGTTPFQRMTNAGYDYVSAGEDMAAGTDMSATALEDFMMVDAGTPCRPHRMNLLDIFPYPPPAYLEVGVGYYQGPSGQAFITEDFGTASTGPFLLGVVYNNADGSNFYEAGNGIAGVTITPSTGSYYAVSSSSGGYAIPIGSSGTITVTASGAGFGPVTKTVTLTGTNIKLDFTTNNQETSSSTTTQTSSTSTQSDTSTTQSSTISTVTLTTSSQATTYSYNPPSITLATPSAIPGSIIHTSGLGFASTDTTCSLTGNAVMSQSCTISNGNLSASFTIGNVASGSYQVTATGNPLGDLASATLQVTNNATQTTTASTTTSSSMTTINATSNSVTSTTTSTGDFLIVPSTSSVTLSQGASGFDTITVFSLDGFNASVGLFTTWLGSSPSGVQVSVTSPLTPAPGGQTTSQLIMMANSTASPGQFTVRVTGMSGSLGHTVSTDINVRIDQSVYTTTQTGVTSSSQTTSSVLMTSTSSTPTLSLPSEPTSCVVASSTAGSDLEPLVQKLRTFRDESILKSKAARSFMILFNAWYYSFSPHIAASISTHPTERALLKDGMYPLLVVLYASYYTYALIVPLGIEEATLITGIVAVSLLGLIYLAPIVLVAKWALRRHTKVTLRPKDATLWVGISFLAFGLAYPLGSQALGAAAANLLLSMLTLSALAGSVMLTAAASTIARTITKWPLILGARPFSLALTPPGLKSEH
jgi:hypothetical protein